MEKDLITTNLLGIRAGLSMISKNTDEIRKHNEQLYTFRHEVETQQAQIHKLEEKLSNLNSERQKLVTEAYSCKEVAEKSLLESKRPSRCNTDYLELSKPTVCIWVFLVFIAYMALLSFIGGVLLEGTIGILLPWLSFILTPITYTLSIKRFLLYIKSFKEGHKLLINSYHRNLAEYAAYEKQIKAQDLQITQHTQKLNNLKSTFEAFMQKNNLTIVIPCEKQITILSKASKLIAKALNDTYGVFLSESDWGNIDLLIHYFETGRADDMKEALQLVDRQRQTDQIVHAIRAAQDAICSHIESAFARMGEALAECFTRLDQRLEVISSQLEANRISSSNENEALLKKLNEQVTATEISHALLEKSNTTNQQLLNDLRYNQRFWVK